MRDHDQAEAAIFFATPAAFQAWLEEHHASARELWVGYYKKVSGQPSITWPESVDVALCFGWIDGLRKSIDEQRYRIRFTPRKPSSIWKRRQRRAGRGAHGRGPHAPGRARRVCAPPRRPHGDLFARTVATSNPRRGV